MYLYEILNYYQCMAIIIITVIIVDNVGRGSVGFYRAPDDQQRAGREVYVFLSNAATTCQRQKSFSWCKNKYAERPSSDGAEAAELAVNRTCQRSGEDTTPRERGLRGCAGSG